MLSRSTYIFRPPCRNCSLLQHYEVVKASPCNSNASKARYFHGSSRQTAEVFTDHYATLSLPSSASAADIKKQFYALSKQYHPDINHSPDASEKFVKISEAYHVLGSADKKEKYDRDFHRAHQGSGHVRGSHSSHTARGPAGGRPASGLSKRRSQFRGPPPSFYAQGGYGTTGGRRSQAQAEADARAYAQAQQRRADGDSFHDIDPDLPYFDRASHRRTHDNLGARRESMGFGGGADSRGPRHSPAPVQNGGSLFANFLIVSAVVTFAAVAASTTANNFAKVGNQGVSRPPIRKEKEGRGDG